MRVYPLKKQCNLIYSARQLLMTVWPRGYQTFLMPNATKHESYQAHKCLNANNCWHFNIDEYDKYNI